MMTNGELNQFILHYLTKDKTHSAIMLTGSWGTGKSYYIQNVLVPFLKEDHKKECVTVSLYGLKSISEVSKNIYLELRAKALSAKGEAAIAGKLIAKTIAKGVVGRLGIDLSVDSSTMQKLYESVDLSNRLVILEDVERSQIGILELLGYVNSLVEQDGVKVLLVANEEEILKNHYCEETELFSLIEECWQATCYFLSFCTGHLNVTDLKISLWDNKTPKIYGAPGIVRCQVNSEKIENIKFQEVPYNRFQIDWLGTRVGQLFELIGCADSRPHLGFLPKTNADINVDSHKIRDICTAFEVEYGFRVGEFESLNTKELVVCLKETIKRYKNDHPEQLSEDVYNSAYNSLSFILLPAREKVWRIYAQFKEVIDRGFKEMSWFSGTILNLTEKQTRADIQWLVRLRNNITHASRTTEQNIPNAIYSRLRVAIYCSTLVRAGYPIEEIATIIKAYFNGRVE